MSECMRLRLGILNGFCDDESDRTGRLRRLRRFAFVNREAKQWGSSQAIFLSKNLALAKFSEDDGERPAEDDTSSLCLSTVGLVRWASSHDVHHLHRGRSSSVMENIRISADGLMFESAPTGANCRRRVTRDNTGRSVRSRGSKQF